MLKSLMISGLSLVALTWSLLGCGPRLEVDMYGDSRGSIPPQSVAILEDFPEEHEVIAVLSCWSPIDTEKEGCQECMDELAGKAAGLGANGIVLCWGACEQYHSIIPAYLQDSPGSNEGDWYLKATAIWFPRK